RFAATVAWAVLAAAALHAGRRLPAPRSTVASDPPDMARHATAPRLGPAFERNIGQVDNRVRFVARRRDATVFLTSSEAVLAVAGTPPTDEGRRPARIVRIGFGGATSRDVDGEARLPGVTNYLVGADSSRWRTGI